MVSFGIIQRPGSRRMITGTGMWYDGSAECRLLGSSLDNITWREVRILFASSNNTVQQVGDGLRSTQLLEANLKRDRGRTFPCSAA